MKDRKIIKAYEFVEDDGWFSIFRNGLLKVLTIRILSCESQRQRRQRATWKNVSSRRADFHLRFLSRKERWRVDQQNNRAASRFISSTARKLDLHRIRTLRMLFRVFIRSSRCQAFFFRTLRRPIFPRRRYEYLISNSTNLLSRSRFFLYSSFSTNSCNFKLLPSCIFSCSCLIYTLLDPFKWSMDYLWIFELQITEFRWCTLLKPLEIARPGTRVIQGHYSIFAGRVKSRIVLVRGTRGANVRTTCVGGSVLLSFTLAKSQSRLTPTCAASERPSSP